MVLMNDVMAKGWWGIHSPPQEGTPRSGRTDYESACDIEEEIGVIDRVNAQVLVIGDEPNPSALLPFGDGVYIYRIRAANSLDHATAYFSESAGRLDFREAGEFSTVPGSHVMFDAACAGWHVDASLSCQLTKSRYVIETAEIAFDGLEALVHRLR